jgi:dolichol-phosphate mannosyltransferase
MDADLQHPPELIGEMTRLWRAQGFDIVNAVKRQRGQEARSKSILTRLYHRLFSGLAGIDVDQASDFKLLDRAVAEQFCGLPERGTFFRGLVAWMGYRQTSIEFDVQPRTSGDSRWSFWKLVTLAIDSIIAFSTVPMHLITLLGVVLAGVSFVLGARTLWLWAAGRAEPGFTTVILLQIGFTAILLIGLGVIGAYIAKIYDEVKHRPRFIIQDQAIGGTADETEREAGKYRKDR